MSPLATVDAPRPQLVTIPAVEIIDVGSWDASTPDGEPALVTKEMLLDAIAAVEAGDARPPVNKFGHTSALNVGDGGPAVGKFVNLRTSDDGMTLLGDLTGVPAWLGDIMASAYPRRSAEWYTAYTADTGRTYSMVITAVAMLGEAYPAVETLDDIRDLFGDDAPALVAASRRGDRVVATTTIGAGDMPKSTKVAARATDDAVFTAFYNEMPWSFWIRELYVDPLEVIATNDDTGGLVRIPYAVDTDGAVSFGEPVAVAVEYIDQVTEASAKARPVATQVFATRADARSVVASTSPDGAEQGEDPMETIDPQLVASRLGLPDDASIEQINEALTAPAEEPTPAPVTAAAPEGTVIVDADEWAATQARLAEHDEFVQAQRLAEEKQILTAAQAEKRFAPARRDHYAAAMRTDRAGTIHLLTASVQDGGLAPGLAGPLREVGNQGGDEASSQASASSVASKVALISGNKTKEA